MNNDLPNERAIARKAQVANKDQTPPTSRTENLNVINKIGTPDTPSAAWLLTTALTQCFAWSASLLSRLFMNAADPERAALSYARRLERDGMLRSALIDCQQVAIGDGPLCESTDDDQDLDRIAYRLEQRFAGESRPLRIYWPSREFASKNGTWTGVDRYPSPHKVSHDLIVTAVWLRFLHASPDVAVRHWKSERFLTWCAKAAQPHGAMPDAAICEGDEFVAIEIGGNYPASWLRHHIEGFERNGWAWQIW